MRRRLSYPLAAALTMGIALQLALAWAPDPGIGPASSGLLAVQGSLGDAWSILGHNLVVLAMLVIGGLLTAMTLLHGGLLGGRTEVRRAPAPARTRMLVYAAVLAVAAWLYFVTGVDGIAATLGESRPSVAFRLVHGWLEFPALLLPWVALAFSVTPRRTLDGRLLGAACACSVGLLVAGALVEAFVVPGLLAGAGA